jgi:MFS family permease
MRQSLAVFRGLCRSEMLVRVLVAWLLFVLAEYAVWIGMLVYAYAHGGPTMAGVIAVVQLVPGMVAAPLLSTMADRWSPTLVLIGSLVAQAVSMAAIAAALYSAWPAVFAYSAAVVATTAIGATRPAHAVVVPALAHHADELTASNAAQGWLESVGIVVAGLLAGLALASGQVGLVFAVSAGATAVAAVLLVGIRVVAARPEEGDQPGGVLESAMDGLRVLRERPAARLLVSVITAQYVVIGALDVLFVLLAVSVLHEGSQWAGYFNTAYGAGGVAAGVLAAALIGRRLAGPIVVSGLLMAVALSLTAMTHSVGLTLLFLGAVGTGRAVIDIATRTLLQRTVRADQIGRVFGVVEGLSGAGLAIGSLVVPALHLVGGATLAIVGTAAVIPLAGLIGGRAILRLDSAAQVPVVEIALLRSMPHFRALPTPELEGLARATQRREFADGQTIIRQGDAGDEFYAIADGQVAVTVDDVWVANRSRSEGLGEIALLRQVPRSATVVAVGPVVVYSLNGATFLSVVTGHGSTQRRAQAIADARLDGT